MVNITREKIDQWIEIVFGNLDLNILLLLKLYLLG